MENTDAEIEKIKKEIDELNDILWKQRDSPSVNFDPDNELAINLQRSRSINYKFGEARTLLNEGMYAFIVKNNQALAFFNFDTSLKIFEEIKNEKWTSNAYVTRAIVRNSIGSPEIALYDGLKGVEYYKRNQNDLDRSMAFYVMGTIYKDLKKYDEAEKYFKDGIEGETIRNMWSGRIYTSLSNIKMEQGKYQEALDLGMEGLAIVRTVANAIGESRALNDIGIIYRKLVDYKNSLEYLLAGLEIRKRNNLKHFILGSLIEVAETYLTVGDLENAILYFSEAEQYGIETNHFSRLTIIYSNLASIFKIKNEFQKAIEIYEKLVELNARSDKKEKESKLTHSESKLLKEKEEEIERLRNVELKKAYEVIEQKNKDIHDSITYAKRIQYALLAREEFLKNNLPEHFVYFNPKDIVSGDFYWAAKVSGSKALVSGSAQNQKPEARNSELFFLAVSDSTGHGVPGAFMSLLNIGFLSEAINEKEILKPNEVLNFVRQRLIDNISKEGQRDGFDGILICIEKPFDLAQGDSLQSGIKIAYAAANNAPIIIKNGEILELEMDHMPVGMGERSDSFKLYSVNVDKGDVLYLYTDGYADQFGGQRGKKFKYKQLNELLLSISKKSMTDQKEILEKTFAEWKGDLEQVDDVCIIGIKI